MEKTIKIDNNTSIKVSNNVGWMIAYRDQFGRDIVPALIPVLTAITDIVVEISKAANAEEVSAIDVIRYMDTNTIRDALIEASGIEMVDIIHIVWAMAKAADDDIDEPKIWVRQFDAFPLDTILPVICDMVMRCMVSTKNYTRLQTAIKDLGPTSTSTASSSQAQGTD